MSTDAGTPSRARTRWGAALALAAALPTTAAAALGGSAATVDADRVAVQGALMRMTRTDAYALHEIRAATGTTIREYVSPTGTVFAVAWQGPWTPDLRQVLGDRFDAFQRAVEAGRRARRGRGVVAIDERDLVVRISGHQRAVYGRAYVPALVPPGVQPEAIR
jgi:Protein of unknown function (DUF2844)